MMYSQLFSGLGIATVSFLSIKLLRFVSLYTKPSSLKPYLHGDSPCAFVTGASDGIGRGFAQELAKIGFNVIIHGRNPTKLESVKHQINVESPNVQCQVAVADASTATNKQIEEMVASFSDLHFTVLINNVGGGAKVQTMEESSADEVDSAMNINARFPAQLTKALLPRLTGMPGPRLIMNIGSLGDLGIPYAFVYGGCKAFNTSMSSCLSVELRVQGRSDIEVLAILVGQVVDTSHTKEPATFFKPPARTMAKAALRRVGCGRAVVVGYLGHAIQKALIDIMPISFFESLVLPTMSKKHEEAKKNH